MSGFYANTQALQSYGNYDWQACIKEQQQKLQAAAHLQAESSSLIAKLQATVKNLTDINISLCERIAEQAKVIEEYVAYLDKMRRFEPDPQDTDGEILIRAIRALR